MKFILALALIFAPSVYAETCAPLLARDKYKSFDELRRSEAEGRDFKIHLQFAGSAISVIAPHGGRIEFGTSEIATAIAGRDFNLYLFNGCKSGDNFCLHVTSARFDEPQAVGMMSRSELGVSVHGFSSNNKYVIVGGLNSSVSRQIARALQHAGFTVEYPATRFKGESVTNIVNRPAKKGVQIEISSGLRLELLREPDAFSRFVRAVRSTLPSFAYQARISRPS